MVINYFLLVTGIIQPKEAENKETSPQPGKTFHHLVPRRRVISMLLYLRMRECESWEAKKDWSAMTGSHTSYGNLRFPCDEADVSPTKFKIFTRL